MCHKIHEVCIFEYTSTKHFHDKLEFRDGREMCNYQNNKWVILDSCIFFLSSCLPNTCMTNHNEKDKSQNFIFGYKRFGDIVLAFTLNLLLFCVQKMLAANYICSINIFKYT